MKANLQKYATTLNHCQESGCAPVRAPGSHEFAIPGGERRGELRSPPSAELQGANLRNKQQKGS